MLTRKRLREVLHYNRETGVFRWRCTQGSQSRGSTAGSTPTVKGYINIKIDGVLYRAHVLAWLYVHGEYLPNRIDHQDRNGAHNWLSNLRKCTLSQNAQNRRKRSDAKHAYKGVTRDSGKRWKAQVYKDGKCYYLGRFDTAEEAASAYDEKALELFGQFAATNRSLGLIRKEAA